MAYTEPQEFVPGAVLGASDLNVGLRDNFIFVEAEQRAQADRLDTLEGGGPGGGPSQADFDGLEDRVEALEGGSSEGGDGTGPSDMQFAAALARITALETGTGIALLQPNQSLISLVTGARNTSNSNRLRLNALEPRVSTLEGQSGPTSSQFTAALARITAVEDDIGTVPPASNLSSLIAGLRSDHNALDGSVTALAGRVTTLENAPAPPPASSGPTQQEFDALETRVHGAIAADGDLMTDQLTVGGRDIQVTAGELAIEGDVVAAALRVSLGRIRLGNQQGSLGQINMGAGRMTLRGASGSTGRVALGQPLFVSHVPGTTAEAANCRLPPGGNADWAVVTSVRAAKREITPLGTAEAWRIIDGLKPVRYRSRVDDDPRQHHGLIAEDVAAVDATLAEWTGENLTGAPSSVAYERLVGPLLVATRDLVHRLHEAEETIRALLVRPAPPTDDPPF